MEERCIGTHGCEVNVFFGMLLTCELWKVGDFIFIVGGVGANTHVVSGEL